ncbi:unnamed protein product [Darwinula stevensoni]|uniref:Heat shock protein 70 n=1 Tax=Darwinula stevensoni TaxID=69355 RepID=A0A7R9FQ93_9CRUS|nr:unnamed protein product [Darwinula stevensoni]CAG0898777.1 unnamed protein product [Darwinula stevensoni]
MENTVRRGGTLMGMIHKANPWTDAQVYIDLDSLTLRNISASLSMRCEAFVLRLTRSLVLPFAMPGVPVVGIDLGTTKTCVAVFENGKCEIIQNERGNRTTPSYVAFDNMERLVGDIAKSQVEDNPENTVYGLFLDAKVGEIHLFKEKGSLIFDLKSCDLRETPGMKRLIGRKYHQSLEQMKSYCSYTIVKEEEKPMVKTHKKINSGTLLPDLVNCRLAMNEFEDRTSSLSKKELNKIISRLADGLKAGSVNGDPPIEDDNVNHIVIH